jgi:hypothetical protein
MQMTIQLGDICKLTGLVGTPELNGQYVEIVEPLMPRTMEVSAGPAWVDEPCYGWVLIADPDNINGYIRPVNLEHCPNITRRAVELHLFGWAREDS